MKGRITNYRRGRHNVTHNQMIVLPDAKKAETVVGKTAIWTSPAKKEIKGKITALHGRNGAVRVLFEKGMPGQAIGQDVVIKD